MSVAIHRAVEHQAATRGEAPAYIDDGQVLTYRDLNLSANAVARALIASRFTRGSLAAVRMERSSALTITLLGILKAGGAYMWTGADDDSWPAGVSIFEDGTGERRCMAVDITRVLRNQPLPGPNLPILTRGSDIACVLRGGDGWPAVLVPHAAITSLPRWPVPAEVRWSGDSGAFDLWLALMSGATVTPTKEPIAAAA